MVNCHCTSESSVHGVAAKAMQRTLRRNFAAGRCHTAALQLWSEYELSCTNERQFWTRVGPVFVPRATCFSVDGRTGTHDVSPDLSLRRALFWKCRLDIPDSREPPGNQTWSPEPPMDLEHSRFHSICSVSRGFAMHRATK
jgi:hypothetical protein